MLTQKLAQLCLSPKALKSPKELAKDSLVNIFAPSSQVSYALQEMANGTGMSN